MRISIRHVTRFNFEERVNYSIHDTRLQPVLGEGQRLVSWTLRGPGKRHDWIDGLGNAVATFSVAALHREIEFVAEGVCETDGEGSWIAFPGSDDLPPDYWLLNRGLARHDVAMDPLIAGLREAAGGRETRIAALHDLVGRIGERVTYRKGATTVDSTALEVLEIGAGVCQDFAHLFIACCRRLGVPARYVSGYLQPAEGLNVGSAGHGWAEAHVQGLGWVGFDAANSRSPTHEYLRLAVGLDYAGAAPVTGRRVGAGNGSEMTVDVSVSTAR